MENYYFGVHVANQFWRIIANFDSCKRRYQVSASTVWLQYEVGYRRCEISRDSVYIVVALVRLQIVALCFIKSVLLSPCAIGFRYANWLVHLDRCYCSAISNKCWFWTQKVKAYIKSVNLWCWVELKFEITYFPINTCVKHIDAFALVESMPTWKYVVKTASKNWLNGRIQCLLLNIWSFDLNMNAKVLHIFFYNYSMVCTLTKGIFEPINSTSIVENSTHQIGTISNFLFNQWKNLN